MLRALLIVSALIINSFNALKLIVFVKNHGTHHTMSIEVVPTSADVDPLAAKIIIQGDGRRPKAEFDLPLSTPTELSFDSDYEGIVGIYAKGIVGPGGYAAPAMTYVNLGSSDPKPAQIYPALPCYNPCFSSPGLYRNC